MRKTTAYLFLLLSFSFSSKAQNTGIGLLRKIYTPNHTAADGFARFVSNTPTPVAFGVPLGYFVSGLYEKEKNLRVNIGFQRFMVSGLSIGTAELISYTLKLTVQRTRPFDAYPDIIPKTKVHSWSFPSGHTTAAFATAMSVSLIHKKSYISVPAFAWAGCVAWSRMYLGVHYPGDVATGALIGMGSSFLWYKLSQYWWTDKRKVKKT